MEILILVLLYYLSQNPDFSESVRPLMAKLKNSEQMLSFLKDLSNFSQTFNTFKCDGKKEETDKSQTPPKTEKEKPQSPTEGIADEFIQSILDSYLKQRWLHDGKAAVYRQINARNVFVFFQKQDGVRHVLSRPDAPHRDFFL